MTQPFALFAELLSYPTQGIEAVAEAVGAPRFFQDASLTELQESYTVAFDLQPACAPYFGHHLLGEDSPLRGPLLAKLAEIYGAQGFRPRDELGDHVAEVLRFLSIAPASAARDDLVRDGLLPALRKMVDGFEGEGHPYREVLVLAERAVRAWFEPAVPRAANL